MALLDAETAALCAAPEAAREVADGSAPDPAWPPAKRARMHGGSGSGAEGGLDPAMTPGPQQAMGGVFAAGASAAPQQRQLGEVEDVCDLTEDDLGPQWVTQMRAAQAAVVT